MEVAALKPRIIALLFLITLFSSVVLVEMIDIFGFNSFRPVVAIGQTTNETVLSWQRQPYPATYYEVEVFSRRPDNDSRSSAKVHRLMQFWTLQNQWTVSQDFPFQTFWRVSAAGIFRRPLGSWSEIFILPSASSGNVTEFTALKPHPNVNAHLENSVGPQPILTWTVVPDAVYYEIEFLSRPPENPNGIEASEHRIFSSMKIFVNGYNPDLREIATTPIYWRVRGLDVNGNPIGVFSDAWRLQTAHTKKEPLKPLIRSELGKRGTADLLYPVYTWIPLKETAVYEVELTRELPENPNGTTPSLHRIWSSRAIGFACYDEQARIQPGLYYYRVRGLTAEGEPLGVWSDAAVFEVDLRHGSYAGTLGDSITHGGGAISYSPADWAYDYQTYLKFPTYNLGRSADTSETTSARFDADVLPFRPLFLIIMTGANSLRAGVDAESVIRDLQSIREKCLAHGIRPIFLTMPPINPDAIHRTFSEETASHWQQELLAVNAFIRRQTYFIDLYPHFADEKGELPDRLAIDGLHYDIAGKKLMATIINANWERVTR